MFKVLIEIKTSWFRLFYIFVFNISKSWALQTPGTRRTMLRKKGFGNNRKRKREGQEYWSITTVSTLNNILFE